MPQTLYGLRVAFFMYMLNKRHATLNSHVRCVKKDMLKELLTDIVLDLILLTIYILNNLILVII
jgi:hypothetical protein